MHKKTKTLSSESPNNGHTLKWLCAWEEEQLTDWKSPQELEAQALAKRVIQRDPEPQYRIALLTRHEKGRLQALGVTLGFIPNTQTTSVYWQKEGYILRYCECIDCAINVSEEN